MTAIAASSAASAQGWGPYRNFPPPPKLNQFPDDKFTFCTVIYENNGMDEALGFGWSTDWPDAGVNFMRRLSQLTTIQINRDSNGEPHQEIIHLTDPALFNYPFIFMSDVGTAGFSEQEAMCLRKYLLSGGFLHADDFWGEPAWKSWEYEMKQVFPEKEFEMQDIPLSHEIFHIVFDIHEVPQVPSIQWWSRAHTTSERGEATKTPHLRGIWDRSGRLMVVMSHNTDIADGWEKESESEEYFKEFSVKKSFPLGVNIVAYAMTH